MKKKILANFISAYKAGATLEKNVLGSLKTAITNWETSAQHAGTEITDTDIIKIVSSEVKKRKDAITLYTEEGSAKGLENADKEGKELIILQTYMPAAMSDEDVTNEITRQIGLLQVVDKSSFGKLMKHFSTNFKGQYDPLMLKSKIEEALK